MSKTIDVAIRQAEKAQERELNSRLGAKMNAASKDGSRDHGFKNSVLSKVASENYDRAIEEIQSYVEDKAAFPAYATRVQRFQTHAIDLINAIRAKRSFPGLNMLTMSKQQDLLDRAMQHFEELKVALRKLEQIYNEIRLEDVKSTVWVIKALVYSVFGLITVGFVLELFQGAIPTAVALMDNETTGMINWIFNRLGL